MGKRGLATKAELRDYARDPASIQVLDTPDGLVFDWKGGDYFKIPAITETVWAELLPLAPWPIWAVGYIPEEKAWLVRRGPDALEDLYSD